MPDLKASKKQKLMLSKETMEGLRITGINLLQFNVILMLLQITGISPIHVYYTAVKSFCELGPQLLKLNGVKYLLSEVFSQDPLERYFARQRHRGGSNENPQAHQVTYNAATLVQQRSVHSDIKSMNVDASHQSIDLQVVSQPLPKRPRISCSNSIPQ